MATLFKLALTATTENILTKPEVKTYFYRFAQSDLNETTHVLTITADKFYDDNDVQVPLDGLTVISTDNGYYSLSINGVLQQSDLYEVSASQVVITLNENDTIPVNAPITLVVTNFAPTATTTISV